MPSRDGCYISDELVGNIISELSWDRIIDNKVSIISG